jgi:glycoprotein endo-alpha-1,2-mannosidase
MTSYRHDHGIRYQEEDNESEGEWSREDITDWADSTVDGLGLVIIGAIDVDHSSRRDRSGRMPKKQPPSSKRTRKSFSTQDISDEEGREDDKTEKDGCCVAFCCSPCFLLTLALALAFAIGAIGGMVVQAKAANPIFKNSLISGDESKFDVFAHMDQSEPTKAPSAQDPFPADPATPTVPTLPTPTATQEGEYHESTHVPTVTLTTPDHTEPISMFTGPPTPQPKLLVGVYYYPWYGANFHNGDGYVRSQLDPPQFPVLGEYDDSKPETIKQHLAWSRQANVGLLVTSWWGPNSSTDSTTKDAILNDEDLGDMKIALHYETSGRIQLGEDGQYSMENVGPDMQYMCDNYFDHPNYYRVDGRPVVVLYISRVLYQRGILDQAVTAMRTSASACGHEIYLIGDQAFWDAPSPYEVYEPFLYLDAVTNYDVYGSTMRGKKDFYAGTELVDAYYQEQEKWRTRAIAHGCRFISSVSPGFNDRGVRLEVDHAALSRRLTPESEPGSLFAYSLPQAIALVDPLVDNLLLVNSFNEWHEDSQIEPVLVGTTTSLPEELTNGVEYQGYGDLYLNILWESTADAR